MNHTNSKHHGNPQLRPPRSKRSGTPSSTPSIVLCPRCSEPSYSNQSPNVKQEEYDRALQYINDCHAFMNNLCAKSDTPARIPEVPNFINMFQRCMLGNGPDLPALNLQFSSKDLLKETIAESNCAVRDDSSSPSPRSRDMDINDNHIVNFSSEGNHGNDSRIGILETSISARSFIMASSAEDSEQKMDYESKFVSAGPDFCDNKLVETKSNFSSTAPNHKQSEITIPLGIKNSPTKSYRFTTCEDQKNNFEMKKSKNPFNGTKPILGSNELRMNRAPPVAKPVLTQHDKPCQNTTTYYRKPTVIAQNPYFHQHRSKNCDKYSDSSDISTDPEFCSFAQ